MARISQNTIAEAADAAGTPSTIAASTTVGDGTAEDTKLVFDGNALDFRMGIDEGTDTLEIGKGNAHGTTAHMIYDTNGIISMPLQSSYSGTLSSTQTIATDTWVKLSLATETYDKNNDFDSSTNYRFTVPVDGLYLCAFNAGFGLTAGNTCGVNIFLNGSEFARRHDVPGESGAHFHVNVVAIGDFDATDYLEFYAFHGEGGDDTITGSVAYTWVNVHKIA